jgi:hypothetical protein
MPAHGEPNAHRYRSFANQSVSREAAHIDMYDNLSSHSDGMQHVAKLVPDGLEPSNSAKPFRHDQQRPTVKNMDVNCSGSGAEKTDEEPPNLRTRERSVRMKS